MPLNEKMIAKRIEELRKNDKALVDGHYIYLTTKNLADHLYLTEKQYAEKLKGETNFSIRSIFKLSRLYQVSPQYILSGGIK